MKTKKISIIALITTLIISASVHADETCQSPYMMKIEGQEDYVYVWTLGVENMGDGQDKLVTVAVNPKSDNYGKVINSLSVGGRNEAHHSGFTDDRKYLWAGGLDTNKLFIFDVHSNPAKPSLYKIIDDFVQKSKGAVGPHTTYALPGRMMITALSNNTDHGGRTALVEYTNKGEYITTHWMPTDGDLNNAIKTGKYADGYGYDVRVLPRLNSMFTSSFTGWSNYMQDFGKMLKDPESMKRFGNTVVRWDLHARQPKEVFDVPGAPLEIRCAWNPKHDYCFTTTALTSKLWLIYKKDGKWDAKEVATIGDPSKVPLPVDISISNDDTRLWINTFTDGKTRLFDISDAFNPKQIFEQKIASQVNMVSSSWDGKRLYYTSSLLANWDKKGDDDEQFLKLYTLNDDNTLTHKFSIDFYKEKLGRAHQMRFGAHSLYGNKKPTKSIKTIANTSMSQL